jgi:hypothetical protein
MIDYEKAKQYLVSILSQKEESDWEKILEDEDCLDALLRKLDDEVVFEWGMDLSDDVDVATIKWEQEFSLTTNSTTFFVGQLEDGKWFWTFFDSVSICQEWDCGSIHPGNAKILEELALDNCSDDYYGGGIDNTKEELLNDIYYSLEIDDLDEDNDAKFYNWAKTFLTYK